MEKITTVGLDLAKQVMAVHGADAAGRMVLRKVLRRDQVLVWSAALPPCVMAMEACGGAHHWARELTRQGHTVRIIAAEFVQAFRKSGKNDANDAEAICTAARQPNMRFVAMKSVALGQQAPQPIDQCRALFDQPLPQPMHTQRRLGESDNRSDRRLQTQTNLPAAARADERMWGKRAVSSMAHASMTAHRSDIELQSVLRYC